VVAQKDLDGDLLSTSSIWALCGYEPAATIGEFNWKAGNLRSRTWGERTDRVRVGEEEQSEWLLSSKGTKSK
jgi:hypothetical protein